jgi:uncharacterized protein (UPF0305 family)
MKKDIELFFEKAETYVKTNEIEHYLKKSTNYVKWKTVNKYVETLFEVLIKRINSLEFLNFV